MRSKIFKQNEIIEFSRDRRNFIKKVSVGTAGLAVGGFGSTVKSHAVNVEPGNSRISFITGNDRRENVYQVLKPFEN